MADAGSEQWQLEADEDPEAASKPFTDAFDVSNILKFDNIGYNVDGTTNRRHEILYETSVSEAETEESCNNFGEVFEEETVELEFEKVKPKLATHSMHCPNCKLEITKVILRRKVIAYRPTGTDPVEPRPEQNYDLVGCCSCLSLFTSSETIVVAQSRGRSWLCCEGVLVEILKSIVYGGLLEVIASLSIVASAAGSNTTALSIVSMALASLIGGVFIIGHNLWDLRDDCYKYTSSQETNKSASNKYKELLGQLNYFPLHAFIAILSFLVFGMVPPVAYGYSFHKTHDKDFTLVVAATATLLCVLLLTMIKACINKCTVLEYFKTVVYYIIIAVSVSGVSYVVGNLVARLVEELGWFNTSSGGDMPCLPRATIPNLETF